jgi:hypothetical protein
MSEQKKKKKKIGFTKKFNQLGIEKQSQFNAIVYQIDKDELCRI